MGKLQFGTVRCCAKFHCMCAYSDITVFFGILSYMTSVILDFRPTESSFIYTVLFIMTFECLSQFGANNSYCWLDLFIFKITAIGLYIGFQINAKFHLSIADKISFQRPSP